MTSAEGACSTFRIPRVSGLAALSDVTLGASLCSARITARRNGAPVGAIRVIL